VLELSGGVGSLPQAPRWNADRRARPSLPSPQAEERRSGARPHPTMRTEGTRVCRRFAFLIFCRPGAIAMELVPPAGGHSTGSGPPFVIRSSSSKTRTQTRRENASSCERSEAIQHCAQGSGLLRRYAPRNDKGRWTARGGSNVVVASSLSRSDASTVVATLMVQNIGAVTANNVMLTTAKLGATIGTPLPQSLGNLAPGSSVTTTVNFNNSSPGVSSTLNAGGTYTGGSFGSTKRVTVP